MNKKPEYTIIVQLDGSHATVQRGFCSFCTKVIFCNKQKFTIAHLAHKGVVKSILMSDYECKDSVLDLDPEKMRMLINLYHKKDFLRRNAKLRIHKRSQHSPVPPSVWSLKSYYTIYSSSSSGTNAVYRGWR